MGYLFQILSVVSFGIGNCLWVFPLKKMEFLNIIIWRSALTSSLFGLTMLALHFSDIDIQINYINPDFAISDVLMAVLLCAFSYFGLFFYVLSLKKTEVSLAVPIASISSFFGVLTGIIIFNEAFTLNHKISSVLFLLGVFVIEGKRSFKLNFSIGVLYNILAAFFWGISFALFKIPAQKLGAIFFPFILELTVLICSVLLLKSSTGKFKIRENISGNMKVIFVLAILGYIGVFFNMLALQRINVSEISLMKIGYPIVSVSFVDY